MRVIIRFSIDNETNSALRNKLVNHLGRYGFARNGNTATWENQHITSKELRRTLARFWRKVDEHTGGGRIDHFWMYSDRTAADDIHSEAEEEDV